MMSGRPGFHWRRGISSSAKRKGARAKARADGGIAGKTARRQAMAPTSFMATPLEPLTLILPSV
jgi:hypothetical protein